MKTLILSLDFINYICHEDGKASGGKSQAPAMEKANKVIAWGRKNGHLVAHVKVGFSSNYLECPEQSPMFSQVPGFGIAKLGTWDTEFHEDLDVQAQDPVIVKHRVSAFYGTDLGPLLRAQRIERIILVGVSTSMAVISTAHDAHNRDYRVTVVSDACGVTRAPETHDYSLALLAPLCEICLAEEFV